MTIVGKLLVFINLVFSLVLGFGVIMVHTVAVRSDKIIGDQKKSLEVSLASEKALKADNDTLRKEKATVTNALAKQGVKEADTYTYILDSVLSQNSTAKADIEARDNRLKQVNDKLLEQTSELKALKEVVKGTQEENKRRQDDYEKLRKTLFEAQENSTKLIEAKNVAEREKEQSKIERNNALERTAQLEAENRKLAEDNIRLTTTKGRDSLATTTSPTGKNPPTTRVEGKVTKIDNELIMLNVGSDRGLKEGNTLEVFRVSNNPRYLGTMRIIKVNPYESVGQMMSRPSEPVRVGDDVAPTTSVVR